MAASTEGASVDLADNLPERLVALCEEFGSPVYVYDLERIDANVCRARNALRGVDAQIRYFEFANRNPVVLERMRRLGIGLSTARPAGIDRALEAGFPPEQIELSGFGLSERDLHYAVERGVAVNVATIGELDLAWRVMPEVPLGVRVDFGGTALDKRGIPPEDLAEFLRAKPVVVAGLHTYLGTNILSSAAHLESLERLLDLLISLPSRATTAVEYVNVGGGFGYNYDCGDRFVWDEYGSAVGRLLNSAATQLGRPLALKFELGRDLVVDAGYFVAGVVHAFEKRGQLYLTLDSNLSHFGRPARYGWDQRRPPYTDEGRHRMAVLPAAAGHGDRNVDAAVVGNSHYSRDWFGFVRVPKAEGATLEGGYVVFLDAGAYSEAMSDQWADEPRPPVVALDGGQARLVTAREPISDLLASPRHVRAFAEQGG